MGEFDSAFLLNCHQIACDSFTGARFQIKKDFPEADEEAQLLAATLLTIATASIIFASSIAKIGTTLQDLGKDED